MEKIYKRRQIGLFLLSPSLVVQLLLDCAKYAVCRKKVNSSGLPDESFKIFRVIMIIAKQGGQAIKRLQPPASEHRWVKIRVKSVRACFYQMVDSLF